jgi:protein CpxP
MSETDRVNKFRTYTSRWSLLALMTIAGLFALVQANAMVGQGFGMRRHARGQMPSVDDQLQRMSKALSLNEDQQSKIKPIVAQQRTEMQQIRNNSSISNDEKFSKMRNTHQPASSQIKALLNEDQQKKFDEFQQRQRERWQSREAGNQDQN